MAFINLKHWFIFYSVIGECLWNYSTQSIKDSYLSYFKLYTLYFIDHQIRVRVLQIHKLLIVIIQLSIALYDITKWSFMCNVDFGKEMIMKLRKLSRIPVLHRRWSKSHCKYFWRYHSNYRILWLKISVVSFQTNGFCILFYHNHNIFLFLQTFYFIHPAVFFSTIQLC